MRNVHVFLQNPSFSLCVTKIHSKIDKMMIQIRNCDKRISKEQYQSEQVFSASFGYLTVFNTSCYWHLLVSTKAVKIWYLAMVNKILSKSKINNCTVFWRPVNPSDTLICFWHWTSWIVFHHLSGPWSIMRSFNAGLFLVWREKSTTEEMFQLQERKRNRERLIIRWEMIRSET